MSVADSRNLPIELEIAETRTGGQRQVQLGIKAWDSCPHRDSEASSDRRETYRVYDMNWEQLLKLQEAISSQIEFRKPLIASGKLTVK